jgi:hypothetical protein
MEKVFVDDVLARYPQASYLSRGGQKVVFSLTHHSYGVKELNEKSKHYDPSSQIISQSAMSLNF